MRMNELQLLALAEKALHDNGKRGHLFKRTSENSKWQMRYFVLFQNILFYFEGENTTSKPSGLIFLEGSYVDKMVTPGGGGGGGGGLYHYHKNSAASIGTANLQHYFVITYRKEGSKTFELKAESESECNAWVHAIENASFSKMLLQKEELEQKHLHLVQIVESEKTAKFTYTQQVEDLSIEIKKLRAELCTLKREWRLTPNARANREGRGGGLAGLNGGGGGGGGGGGAGGTGADGEGGDPNAYGTDDEMESEDIQKIKKVQSFFRGWLCRRRWKSIVNEYINSPHAENMRKRNSLVFRMVEAEEEYLEQLQLMVSCFLRPFKMAASSQKPPCSHDEVNSIFLNAETVMFLHQIFLKGLSARMDCWPTLVLGDLFDMLLPMLSIYQEYVRNHHFSLQVLAECKQREKFASMLRRLEEKPVTQGRTLETFLTYPMHQVPRYIITLHELLAHTPHNHVERKSLENARMKLEELSRQMHDEVSETENIRNNLAIERIIVGGCDILLDVNQVFIRKGSVLQVLSSSSTGGEGGGGGGGAASRFKSARARLGGSFRGDKGEAVRQCYLFSNHMLLCTRTSGGKLTLIEGFGKIPLQEATLIEDPNEQFQFTVDDGDGSLSSASSHSSETGGGGAGGAGTAGGATISFAAIAATNAAAAAAANSTPTKDGGGGGGSSSTPGGKDFGGLDFKIIIDAKMGPPMTIHLVAPTLQEKTAWISDISQPPVGPGIVLSMIMRRFKTNSASSSASSSRKSSASSMGGLFKSASSPTPPTNFSTSIDGTAAAASTSSTTATTTSSSTTTSSTTSSSSSRNNTVLFRYGRAINRSLHYVSGGGSHSNSNNSNNSSQSNNSSHDGGDGGEEKDHRQDKDDEHHQQQQQQHLLKVTDGSGSQESTSSSTASTSAPKSPLSPKLPSRFKFSKNKSSSSSSKSSGSATANCRSKSGEGAPLVEQQNNGGPGSTSLDLLHNSSSSSSFSKSLAENSKNNKASLKAKSAASVAANSSSRRPMLIRQQSDEHQHALQEKVRQQENGGPASGKSVAKGGKGEKAGKGGKTFASASSSSSSSSGSKNVGKLRKMAALGSTTNSGGYQHQQPSDIVYEEGESNKCIDNVHFNDLFHGTLNDASSITMPHSIRFFGSRNDPRLFKDDVDIRFSRTLNSCKLPQIRYASPERLFERLTDLRFLSIDFLNTFLLTYRVFTDSITVIEALKRVHYNPEMQLNAMSSSSLHDSSGSLDGETGLPKGQAANQGGAAGGNHGEGGSGGSGSGGAVGHHLHPSASPGHSHHHHHHHHGTLLNINMAGQSTGPVAGVSAANELVSTTIEYDYGRRVSTSSVLSDIAELGGEGGGGGRGGHHHHHRESLIAEVTTNVHAQVTTVQQVSSREQQQAKEMQLFSASSPLIRNSQHWRLSYRKFEEEQARERYLKRMNNRQQHGSISSTSSSVMGGGSVVGGAGGGGGGPPNQLSQAQQQQQQQQQEGNIFILPAGEPMLAPAITDPIAVPVPPPPSPEVPGYYQKEMAKREKEKQFQAAIGNDSCSGSGSGSDNSHDGSPTSTNSAEETTQLHYQQLQQQQQQQFGAIQASSPQRGASNSNAQQTGGGGGGGGKQQSKSNELLLLSATANATAVVGSRGGASSSPASVSSAAAALQVPAHSQSMDTLTDGHGCSSLSSATSSATLVGSDSKSGSPRPSPVRKSPPNGSDFPTAAGSHSPFGQTASQQQQQQQQQMGNSRAAADEDMEDDGMEREEQEDEEEEEYVEGRYKSTNPFATPIRRKSTSQQQQQPIQSQLSEGTPPPTPPLPGTPPSRKHSTISTGTGHSATSQATPPPISSVGSCFVLPSKAHQQQQQPSAPVKSGGASADARSSSLTGSGGGHHPTAPSGRLSATSTTLTMNYLRVRGAGSKRGSGSSETESAAAGGGAGGGSGSTSVTPRSSFQTDTTGISTPRSSFQHPDSPQMSSKAGVVVTSSRATSRRSSTASAASAFAVATAASSNPPEPTDPLMRMQMMNMAGGGGGGAASRGSSRFSSATGADLKIPGAGGGGGGGGSLAGSISGPSGAQAAANAAAAVAANAARCKRESMISTAATMRVLNVLRHWVSKHSQDFENDERLLKVTTDFLEELVHNTNLLPAEHKAAVQLQQMIAKQTLDAKEKVDLDVLLAPPITPSRDNIETLSALEIAECMTFIDHNIFVRIQSEEFLGQAWMKDEKTVNAFHILLMTKHFNDVSRMVASEILRLPEIPKRVSVIEKWAAVADICRCLHNFNGVLQICAAFTNSSVFRLKRTWEKLNKTTKQTIDKLQNLVSTDGRFRNMREALHRCDPPCIPYLGMYLTDLSFIEEGTPNFTDDGLLNFSKMRMIAHVIREIRHFQQTPYKIEHNPRVTNYLLDTSRHLGDEVLYQMSLCLEPRLSRLGSRATTVVNATSPSSAGTTFATATTTSQSHQ